MKKEWKNLPIQCMVRSLVVEKQIKRYLERFSLESRKYIRICFGFALLRLLIGLRNPRNFFFQSEVKPQTILNRRAVLSDVYVYWPWDLIGSFDWLGLLWLARVITLVLVLRHSIENCSIKLYCTFFWITNSEASLSCKERSKNVRYNDISLIILYNF